MQAFLRAGVRALPAADALRGAGNLLYGKRHRADPLTGPAGDAPLLLPVNLHEAEAVEPAVMAPRGHRYWQKGRNTFTESSKIASRIPSFQRNSPPAWLRSASLAPSRGSAPSRVPEGQRYLQKAGTLAKPPNRNMEPTHTSRTSVTYFPYFRTRWPGRRFFFLKRGILCKRSCTSPKGHSQPQTKRPSRLPNTKKKPRAAKGT